MSASRNLPIPFAGGAEYDALTRAKRVHSFRPGERKQSKKSYWRRFRRLQKYNILKGKT